ncbi:MAG: hypothetical protein HRU70_03775 [Phycisphaeraceae bacterium]|nr:MAG: hypothetical protein HRU70_03775 [Phycisphaeraceae bacterium]
MGARVKIEALPELAAKVEERIRLKDRRRDDRVDLTGTALAVLHDRDGGPKTAVVGLLNGSSGGLAMVSHLACGPGCRVELRADAGQFKPGVGQVVRCEPMGDGAYRLALRVVKKVAA